MGSHDLEDLVRVIDGRAGVLEEVRDCSYELREFVATGIGELMADRYFMEALPGYFEDGAARGSIVVQRMKRLSEAL